MNILDCDGCERTEAEMCSECAAILAEHRAAMDWDYWSGVGE